MCAHVIDMFPMDHGYHDVYTSGLEVKDDASENEKRLCQRISNIFASGVIKNNYVDFFHHLLWYEESMSLNDLEKHNKSNVTLLIINNEYAFYIPKGTIKHTSLIIGCTINIKPHKEETPFEVVKIRNITKKNLVFIKRKTKNMKIPNQYFKENAKFDIQFVQSRVALERMHAAVAAAGAGCELQRRVFPTENLNTPIIQPILQFFNSSVEKNPEQKRAVEHIVSRSSGLAPYLLHGPPGTGKTVTIVEAILQLVQKDPNNRILVCADSNAAADNVAAALVKYIHLFDDKLLFRANSKSRDWKTLPDCLLRHSNRRDEAKTRAYHYNDDEPTYNDEPDYYDEPESEDEPPYDDEPDYYDEPESEDEPPYDDEPDYYDEPESEDEPPYDDEPDYYDEPESEDEPPYDDEPDYYDEPESEDEPPYDDEPDYYDEPESEDEPPFDDEPDYYDEPESEDEPPYDDEPDYYDEPESEDEPPYDDEPDYYDEPESEDEPTYDDEPDYYDELESEDGPTYDEEPNYYDEPESEDEPTYDEEPDYYDEPESEDEPPYDDEPDYYDEPESEDEPTYDEEPDYYDELESEYEPPYDDEPDYYDEPESEDEPPYDDEPDYYDEPESDDELPYDDGPIYDDEPDYYDLNHNVHRDYHDLRSYKILVTTLSYSAMLTKYTHHNGLARSCTVSHVFIDEAAQASEPATLVPLKALLASDGQIVLAGDPRQLGPFCISHDTRTLGLGLSLMERLKKTCDLYNEQRNDPNYVTMLRNNFRSDPAILDIPNAMFYNGQLRALAEKDPISKVDILGKKPNNRAIVFHGVLSQEQRVGPSFHNKTELKLVQLYITLLIEKHKVKPSDIGVVTPYKGQVTETKSWLAQQSFGSGVEVGSVEAFQGREKRVVIISTVRARGRGDASGVRAQLGFLADDARFNVAITRAKAKVVIIGNPHCLELDEKWRAYINKCRELGTYHGYDSRTGENADDQITSLIKNLRIA